jgi:hypothetical protein
MFKKKPSYGPATQELLDSMHPKGKSSQDKRAKLSGIDYDIRQAVSHTRIETVTYMTLFVVVPVLAFAVIYHGQRNERIDCGKLSASSIQFLAQRGEKLPLGCR